MGALAAAGGLRRRPPLGRARARSGTPTCCARASVYEEECGHHTITQGGYYQYDIGENLGYRSWLHYLLPIVYTEPELAREILRYSIKFQPRDRSLQRAAVRHRAAVHALRPRHVERPRLLAAARRGRVRARHARHEVLRRAAAVLRHRAARRARGEHIKVAFAHQESLRGPHGGYIMGATGDWSDFSTELGQMTESMLVTAQLAYAYPKLAELADLRGDTALRRDSCARRGAELRDGRRARSGPAGAGTRAATPATDQVGTGVIFGEPQPWAILAGVPTRDQAQHAGGEHPALPRRRSARPAGRRRSARRRSPARDDPDVTERGPTRPPTAAARAVGAELPAALAQRRLAVARRRLVRRQRLADLGARRARRRRPERARAARGTSTRATRSPTTPTPSPTTGTARSRVDDVCTPSTPTSPRVRHRLSPTLGRPDHRAADVDGHGRDPPGRRHADAHAATTSRRTCRSSASRCGCRRSA